MSEDFPAGEQPLKPEEHLAEAALEHLPEPTSIEVTETDTSDSNSRVDESKAWDMAHAGKDKRDRAAEQRIEAKAFEGIADKKSEIVEGLYDSAQELHAVEPADNHVRDRNDPMRLKYSELYEEYYDKADKLDLPDLTRLVKAAVVGNEIMDIVRQGGNKQEAETLLEDSLRAEAKGTRRAAEYSDGDAERLETWAAILHDNPPSKAFLNKYYRTKPTSRELMQLEDSATFREQEATRAVKEIEEVLSSPGAVLAGELDDESLTSYTYSAFRSAGLTFRPAELIRRVYGDDSDEVMEWQRRQTDPNTTLGKLRDIYATAFLEGIRPQLESYKRDRVFLEDIKSGRAAQWQ